MLDQPQHDVIPNSVSYMLGIISSKIEAFDKKLDIKTDSLEKKLDEYKVEHRQDQEDHEKRLRALEKSVWRMSTISGAFGGCMVAVLNYGAPILYDIVTKIQGK